jgi:hypothetical protein
LLIALFLPSKRDTSVATWWARVRYQTIFFARIVLALACVAAIVWFVLLPLLRGALNRPVSGAEANAAGRHSSASLASVPQLHSLQCTKEEKGMKSTFSCAFGVAAALGLSMAAFGQTTGQAPAQPQPKTQTTATSAGQAVTVVGCVQREADYRKAHDLGRGGAVGTGVGAGNEFVLINAAMASAARSTGTPAGTTGAAGEAYELSGKNEGQASQYVGKRVEITGTLKPSETAGGAPTGGPTAGAPPRGVDVVAEDLKLRELEVTSVREATGICPQ